MRLQTVIWTIHALIGCVVSNGATAWETDVHYGLTKWLALRAGFGDGQAEDIARGAQLHDTGAIGPVTLGVYSCFRDRNSSLTIRDRHFPSYEDAPSDPDKRRVDKNALRAKRELENIINQNQYSLTDFGRALHPYQDSWSHQGVPDIAPLCSKKYAYSHPKDRGGWSQHRADQTIHYIPDTVETARHTFSMMVEYLRKRRSGSWTAPQWDSRTHADVLDFADRDTAIKKAEWFRKHGFKDPWPYLKGISLPFRQEGREMLRRMLAREPRATGNPLLIGDGEKLGNAKTAVEAFLKAWLDRASIQLKPNDSDGRGKWLERFADIQMLEKNLRTRHGSMDRQNVYAAFEMWLVEDHGLIVEAGHGSADSFARIRDVIAESPRASFDGIPGAFAPLGREGAPYALLEDKESMAGQYGSSNSDAIAVFLRFKHAARDVVMVVFRRSGNNWYIVDIAWAVDE